MSVKHCPVRRGTHEDLARFVELGLKFYAEEGQRDASPRELARFALSHVSDKARVFLLAGQPAAGCLCGMIAPHYLTGEPTAFKTAWYAIPGARGYGAHLLRAFEAWAAKNGARRIIIAGRHDRTLTLLARREYQPLETVYAKDLPWQKQPYPSLSEAPPRHSAIISELNPPQALPGNPQLSSNSGSIRR